MESWNCGSEGKGYFFLDKMEWPIDALMRNREALCEWDNTAAINLEKDGFFENREEAAESIEFMELGVPDLFRKSVHGSQHLDSSSCELDSDSSKRVNSPTHFVNSNSSLGEEESESKHSCLLLESNINDSSLIDLKLGRLDDCKDARSDRVEKHGLTLSSSPSTIAKRSRTTSLSSEAPVCQVYGCNMDLSSSKDYHKRHKVCDVHSKAAKVIVNGIEQRFCQQCSRFHLLAEFDDGKRSCRRRLAEHNERRRKPQYGNLSGRPPKILKFHQGNGYVGSFQKRTQFTFEDTHTGGFIYTGKFEQANYQNGFIKLEGEPIQNSQPTTKPSSSGYLLPKPLFHLNENVIKKQCFGIASSGYTASSTSTASTMQELTGALNSNNCALSLLSAPQSLDLPNHSSLNHIATSLVLQGNSSHSINGKTSVKASPLENYAADGTSSIEVHKLQHTRLPDAALSVELEAQANGATIDLGQLSSQLQRVEQQRNSVIVKLENEDLCHCIIDRQGDLRGPW